MSSAAKAAQTITLSELQDGPSFFANAADVSLPLQQLLALLLAGRLSVSADDTHLKQLFDAIEVSSGLSKAIGSPAANEILKLSLDAKLRALLVFLSETGHLRSEGLEAAGVLAGYVPLANGAGGVSWGHPAVGTFPVDVIGTAGEALALRDYVCYISGSWWKVDANDMTRCGYPRGLVTQAEGIPQSASGSIRLHGEVSGFSGLIPCVDVYAADTPGESTQIRPTIIRDTGPHTLAKIGVATRADALFVYLSPVYYVHRMLVPEGGTLSIMHYADTPYRQRLVSAYLIQEILGTIYAEFNSTLLSEPLNVNRPLTYTVDQCTGGTASASSVYSTYVAANGFDNANTNWLSLNATYPQWLEYQFTAAKAIRRYTIKAPSATMTRSPKDFSLQYFDGAEWLTADTRTGQTGWTASEVRTYDVERRFTSTRWRLYITQRDGATDYTGLQEVEMLEAATYTRNDKLAAPFTVAQANPEVQAVQLSAAKTATPQGTLTLRLETDAAGSPSGTLVDPQAVTTLREITCDGSVILEFPAAISLQNGVSYWLVISSGRTPDYTNAVVWQGASSGSPFAAGKAYQNGSWVNLTTYFSFQVLSGVEHREEAATLGRWSTGTRDLAMRYGDLTGALVDIVTTFKNVQPETLDVVGIVRLD